MGDTIYNRRQYERMLQTISDYENERVSLKTLVINLEALVGTLRDIPIEWKDLFLQNWGVLDDVYAELAYTHRRHIDELCVKLISDALLELRQLIKEKM